MKIGRANEHLNALKRELLAWRDTDPFTATRGHDALGGRHSITIHIKNPPPLEHWSVICGDCFHDLRCALDHFVHAIDVHESGSNPPPDDRDLQFPITDTPHRYIGAAKRIKSLSSRARKEIELVQPYYRPHHGLPPLLGLPRDMDKHRLLNVVVSRPAQGRFSFTAIHPKMPLIPTSIGHEPGPIKDGAEVAWFTIDPPNPDVKYENETAVVVAIAHEPGPSGEMLTEVVAVLEWIEAEVTEIINRVSLALYLLNGRVSTETLGSVARATAYPLVTIWRPVRSAVRRTAGQNATHELSERCRRA